MAGDGTYEQLDDAFAPLTRGDTWLMLLHDAAGWLEGPVRVPTARCLILSDIPADRLLRWDEVTAP